MISVHPSLVTYHSSTRHSPYPSHSATPVGPSSGSSPVQSTSMLQETSGTLSTMQNPVPSKFNSAAVASHEMDVDVGHVTSEPQSTGVSKDLISNPAIVESGMFSFFSCLYIF